MSKKKEPKVRAITLLDRQTQLEAEIKRLKALLPVRREGESDANYAFRVDQANANFKARGNLNIKGDPNKIISRHKKGGYTAESSLMIRRQEGLSSNYTGGGLPKWRKDTIGNTITKLEATLSASRAQIGKRYLTKKEANRLGVKWNPTLANDSKMVNPDYNEYYDLDYAKPIVVDLPSGGTFTAHPGHPKYWDLKGGQKFTPHQLNPSVFTKNNNNKLTISPGTNKSSVQPGPGSTNESLVGANKSDVAAPPVVTTKGNVVNQVPAEVKQKVQQKAPAELAWVDIDNRARGHTLTGPNYSRSVGGKNSVANNKARLLLDRARDINRAYGSQNDAWKTKMLNNPRTQLELEA